MDKQIRILLVEDNKGDYILVREMLVDLEQHPANKGMSFELTWADRLTAGLQHIGKQRFDVILLDLSLPDAHGLDGFYIVRAVAANVPILVLTGHDDQTVAFNAVQSGAQDFLVKGKLDGNLLFRAIRYSIERNQVLLDLENARERAEREGRARTEFLISMSDEIANPLKSIVRLTKSVLDANLTPEQRESLEHARTSGQSLIKTLSCMLDFARIENGSLAVRPVEFKLREYLGQIITMLEPQAREKGVELRSEIKESVPNTVKGDPERLGQVIQNLVENAVRFGKIDGVKGRVDVACELHGQTENDITLHFAVNVHDANISLQEQQLVFESFAQADVSSLRKYGATGLGLAVSSKLVELMGGRAWVKSEAGKGASFHFTVKYDMTKKASDENGSAEAA